MYIHTYILGLGDSSDSAIIVVTRVTITIAIAKNYCRDSGRVVTRMRSQNCHTSTSHVKKRAKMVSNFGDWRDRFGRRAGSSSVGRLKKWCMAILWFFAADGEYSEPDKKKRK